MDGTRAFGMQEREQELQSYLEGIEDEYFPQWASHKSPFARFDELPVALVTYGDLDHSKFAFTTYRRSALASPRGAHPESGFPRPVANWMNHYHKPNQYEQVKDLMGVGETGGRSVLRVTHKGRRNMWRDPSLPGYLQDDGETVCINPIAVMDTLADKQETVEHLMENGLPTIPSLRAEDVMGMDDGDVEAIIGEGDRGVIAKPCQGHSGNGFKRSDSLDGVRAFLDNAEISVHSRERLAEEVYQVQRPVPHRGDYRVIFVGDDIVNAMYRGKENGEDRTNLSLVDSVPPWEDLREMGFDVARVDDLGAYGKAYCALRSRRAVLLDVDVGDHATVENNPGGLPGEVERLAYDIVESFGPREFDYSRNLPQKPFVMGIDIMETDLSELDHLPDDAVDTIAEYSDGETAYVCPEINGNPGSMVDLMARWQHTRAKPLGHQMSPLHLMSLMRELAGAEPLDVAEVHENEEDPVWRRFSRYYPDLGDEYVRAIEEYLIS